MVLADNVPGMDTYVKQFNSRGRAVYSSSVRQNLISEFLNSGLTRAQFCGMRDVNPKTFGRWMRSCSADDTTEVPLREVTAVRNPVSDSIIRVVLPNRVEVVVPIHSIAELACVLQEAGKCSA